MIGKIMKKLNVLLSLVLLTTSFAALAETTEEKLMKTLQARLGQNEKINAIQKTPWGDLYEVHLDDNIVYTDPTGDVFFVGRVVDSKTMHNYTKDKMKTLGSIDFSSLPLDAAIKIVKGNGKRVLAIFEDPNCGYCKQMHKALKNIDNITLYTFTYNILSKDSFEKSRNIWCSADPKKAWLDWMHKDKLPAKAPESCLDVNNKVAELGKSLRITGTPVMFLSNGQRIRGAVDAQTLEKELIAANLPK
jgi:thiol:disulfide interchange protein DsbC